MVTTRLYNSITPSGNTSEPAFSIFFKQMAFYRRNGVEFPSPAESDSSLQRILPVVLTCQFCGSAMVVRLRKTDSAPFWGCVHFPKCRGNRNISRELTDEACAWKGWVSCADTNATFKAFSEYNQWRAELGLGAVGSMFAESPFRREDRADSVKKPDKQARTLCPLCLYVSTEPCDCALDADIKKEKKMTTPTRAKKAITEATPDDEDKEEGPIESVGENIARRMKRAAKKAPVRMLRMQALTQGKDLLLSALEPHLEESSFGIVRAILDSDAGSGAVLGLLGMVGPHVPKVGRDPRVMAICDEFLDEGTAKGLNQVVTLLTSVLKPVFETMAEKLPPISEVAEAVSAKRAVKKSGKKRIATTPSKKSRAVTTVTESVDMEFEEGSGFESSPVSATI